MPSHFSSKNSYSFGLLFFIVFSFTQLTSYGSVSISGGASISVISGSPYATLSAAITALNTGGAITSPVFVDVSAGHTEILTAKITMTISGTSTAPITIRKSGTGANPKLTSYIGTNAIPSATADGMFAFVGCDYVTIDGIDLEERATNTTPTTVMEFGYAFFKASSSNGAQNNTIKNCVINLNRVQNTNWSTTGHTGSIGILFTNTTNTSNAAITTTSISGSNSNNKFYSNSINNCNSGIAIVGYAAPSPYTLADIGNDIGGSSVITGNSILDFGGAPSAANIATGVFVSNQVEINCSYNMIKNNTGAGVNHVNILRGITVSGSVMANGTFNNNLIQMKGSGTTTEVAGISCNTSTSTVNLILNVNQNNISGEYLTATSGGFYGIYISGSMTANVMKDSIHDVSYANQTTSGTGGGVALLNILNTSNANIQQNDIRNISCTGLTGFSTNGIFCNATVQTNIQKNTLNNITLGGTGTFSSMKGIYVTGVLTSQVLIDSNSVSTLTNNKVTGNGDLDGIQIISSGPSDIITNNTITQLTNMGSGATYGIACGSSNSVKIISNNTISSINSASTTTVTGCAVNSGTLTMAQNKIERIVGTYNGSPIVSGVYFWEFGISGEINFKNNIIGLISAPNANTSSNAAPTVRGIFINSVSPNCNISVANNSVYLNGTSSGTNFSSAGIYHTTSNTTPATTGNLNLRNNLIYNLCTPKGTGIAVAFQRGSSNKLNFNALSDRNLFYAGIPSSNHLIFTDTTSYLQTLNDYKLYMLPIGAEQNSYNDSIVFQSTTGTSNDFLKFDLAVPSLLESRGHLISGLSTDYIGTVRAGNPGYSGTGSSPDIGAWELDGTPINGCNSTPVASNAIVTNTNPPCASPMVTLSLDVNYGLGIVYQWEESTLGAISGFTPIIGAINSTLTISGLTSTWYRCVVTCLATSQSVTSTAVHVEPLPLAGSYLIDNTGVGNYISFYEAIADLNCKGITGPVTFNVSAGQIFNETTNLELVYSGSITNPIKFQKIGSGANPVIRRTGTINDTDAVIKLIGADYYSFDGINFEQSGTTASNYVEYGIYIKGVAPNNGARNNTFKNGVITLTNNLSASRGVFMQRQYATTDDTGTNSQNRFINMTVQQAMAGYYLSGMALDMKDHDNEITSDGSGQSIIQNIGNTTVGNSVVGVYTDEQYRFTIQHTEIKNLTCTSSSIANGLSINGDSLLISSNNIHDIAVPVSINCIIVNAKSQAEVSNNTVQSISSSAVSNATSIKGISAATTASLNPDNGSIVVKNNIIYHLYNTGGTTSQSVGIVISKGQPLVYNNMISDLRAGNSGTNGGTHGIVFASNALSTTIARLYYNTIFLTDSSTNNLYVSAGISSSSTTGKIDVRNNVISNQSNVSSGAMAAVIFRSNSTDIMSDSSDDNLFYAGNPGVKNVLYYDGTNSASTLNAFKSLAVISPAESHTDQEHVIFQLLSNGLLRPDVNIPTKVESNAQVISGINLDFENEIRNPITPDRGADEGNYTPGLLPCTGEPVSSSTVSSPSNPCPGTTFTLSLDVNFNFDYSFQWEVSTTGSATGFTPIAGATNAIYTTTTNNIKWYRCVVTCINSLQSKPSLPLKIEFLPLSGTYLIDKTGIGNYVSFNDALNDLSCKGASGAVIFNVTSGQVFAETTNLICSYQGSSINTITFKKLGTGTNPVIRRSGTSALTDFIFKLNGADYITFDGIDFEQTGTTASNYVEYGIHIVNASVTNGASNNTFKNGVVTVTNLSGSTKGVYIQSPNVPTTNSGTNNNNRFINMTVQQAFEGYRILGSSTSAYLDNGNEILKDTSIISNAVSLIQNIGNSTVNAWATGVYAGYQTNFKCLGTEFSNFNSAATVNGIDGIRLTGSALNTAKFLSNNFHNFSSPGSINGIVVDAGTSVFISHNTLSAINVSASGTVAYGIFVIGSGIYSSIGNNIMYDITNTGSLTTASAGIITGNGTHLVHNNMISGLHAPNSTNTSGSVKGIYSVGGTSGSTTRIYHNTIYLDDVGANASYTAAGIFNIGTVHNLDIRNNVVVNKCDVSIGNKAVAFWKTTNVDNVDNVCNNNLWYAGTPGTKNLIYFNGTDQVQTITAYKLTLNIAPAEANAVTENVAFAPVSNGLLRPSPTIPTLIESGGTYIPLITSDFENDNRNISAPDRGADEGIFTAALPFAIPGCVTNVLPSTGSIDLCQYNTMRLSWSPPSGGGPVTAGYDVFFGTNSNPPFVTNTNNLFFIPGNLQDNTTYYWKIEPKNQTGSATGCTINSFTTSNTAITSVVPATVCGEGLATLTANGNGNLNWYDSSLNGNLVQSGNSFTSSFTNTSTYYVSAEGGITNLNGGKLMPSIGAIMNNTNSNGLAFNASSNFILKTVDVYTSYSGNLTVVLQNPNTGSVQSLVVAVPPGNGSSPKTLTLNLSVTQGNGWQLKASNYVLLSKDLNDGNFPYSIENVVSITNGLNGGIADSSYNFFYNWRIQTNTTCISPRVAVTATVTPAPPITITPASPVSCQNAGATNLTASSTYPYTYYFWSPATSLVGGNNIGTSVQSYNGVTTTYTVTATNGVCTASKTITHVVHPIPQYTYTSSNSPVCAGETLNLYAMGAIGGFALDTNSVVPFIDISSGGLSIGSLSDNSEHTINTPGFPFNGTTINQVRIGTNGLILLGQSSGEISEINAGIPTYMFGTNVSFLAPYWDDLDVQLNSSILTKTQDSILIIQFNNLLHHDVSNSSITFQIQIDTTNGKISFVYQDVELGNPLYDLGKSATIGLQMNETKALQYSFNSSSLANGKSIRFIPEDLLTTYNWTGPAGFTSTVHFPSLQNVSVANSGTYTITATTSHGCVVSTTLQAIVNPPVQAGTTNHSACSSYYWAINGNTYTQSGVYHDTSDCLVNTLNLTILQGAVFTDTVMACNSYTWAVNGISFTNSGTYQNITGCDTQFLQLSILPSGITSTSVSSCDSYTWAANATTYTTSGLYQVVNGCDTIQLLLTILSSSSSSQTISAVNSYTWSQNGITYTSSGMYTATSLNPGGCIHTSTLILTITSSGLQSYIAYQDQSVSCFGFNDGSCGSIVFPTGNYLYQLDGGLQSNTSGFFSGLTPGVHTVCASDGLNTFCDTVTISEPALLSIQFTTDSMVSCQGNDGALSVQITGGTNSLQGYLTWWINSNGDTLNNVLNNNFALSLNNLTPGMYQVVTEDDHGCFAVQNHLLTTAPSLIVDANFNAIQCHQGTTNIIPSASGGVAYLPYVYTINGMPLGGNYAAGTYTVLATDARGCTASTVITITQPALITSSSSLSSCTSYSWNGNVYTVTGIYTNTFIASNGCDSVHTLDLTITNGIRIAPKVILSGCYQGNGLMYDSLRTAGLIPLSEPYTLMNFIPVAYPGGETIPASLLSITGNDAIVDWIHLEIRSAAPAYNKLATMNALLQRDGDIVDINGNPPYFPSICPGSYHVVVKHRNHLGVMSSSALPLTEIPMLVDFTTSTNVWVKSGVSNPPRKTDGSYFLLWAGDARTDKNVKYNGLNNDKESVLNAVGAGTSNNILYPVYRSEDVNLDARVKYNNADNDKNFLLMQVLNSNPNSPTSNAVISQHTPN